MQGIGRARMAIGKCYLSREETEYPLRLFRDARNDIWRFRREFALIRRSERRRRDVFTGSPGAEKKG
jgi:hypothetical protein